MSATYEWVRSTLKEIGMSPAIFIIFFALLLQWSSATAGELDHYLAILDEHPSIKRILQEKEALEFQADGALGLPDPVISLGVENVPLWDPSFDQYLPSSKTIGFSQNIPNPNQRKAQQDAIRQSAESQRLLAEYRRSRLYALFYTKLAEYKRIGEQLAIEEKKRRVIGELKQFYEGEVFAGEPVFQKTFSIDLELSDVEKSINDLSAESQMVEANFIQLVGEVPGPVVVNHNEKIWSGQTEALFPVLLAQQNSRVADERIKVANAEFKPDFGLAAVYKNREDGENNTFDGDDWFSLQFRMSIPLWASSNQKPKLAAARSRKRSALYNYEDVQRSWQMQMTNIESKKEASRRNIVTLNNKRVALEESLEALTSTYGSGQTSLEPSLLTELSRLSLLSRIAKEEETYIRNLQEANAHIQTGKTP
ncbi:MAG: cobalt-zinc-cadmium efflux system outer membrane protein [Desulforhopalus sp.]|jgi:cobalt-zinc-cadmium efflux system outer membrane protein